MDTLRTIWLSKLAIIHEIRFSYGQGEGKPGPVDDWENQEQGAKERWNSKLMNYWDENSPESLLNRFTNKLSNNQSIFSLNLDRVFVLTSARTASASELLINGLDPYIA